MVTIYGLLMLVALVSRASALAPCACTSDFRPVCGSDGTTYANQCLLECEVNSGKQITKARDGSCEPAEPEQSICSCTFNYAPVCGSDGQTYPNQCALECDQATTPELRMAHPGECKCTCTRESQFVCGSDGTTYSNRCLLECSQSANPGLQLAHVGPCEDIV